MPNLNKVIARGDDAMTLLILLRGELINYGYNVSEVKIEYEPAWGEQELVIEVKPNGG